MRACEPFCGWGLPEADELEFQITGHGDRFGHFRFEKGRTGWPQIAVSQKLVGTHETLLLTLGHEMIHLKEFVEGVSWGKDDHGPLFMRHARKVCKVHAFEMDDFL